MNTTEGKRKSQMNDFVELIAGAIIMSSDHNYLELLL